MPARAPRGFGAKNIFFNTIFPHFEENHIRLAKAFLGSACEQWINTEIFIAVLENNKDQWIRPESSKRDLVFYKSEADEKNCKASLICETKIIYCSEYPSQQTEKLRKLASQIKTGMSELNTTKFYWTYFLF